MAYEIIIETPAESENQIIIRCRDLDEELMNLIYAVGQGRKRIKGYSGKAMVQLVPADIYYFESVDNIVNLII